MRTIALLAIFAASIALGGCFHHQQQVYAEPMPSATPPLK
jgi:hypothetical protein